MVFIELLLIILSKISNERKRNKNICITEKNFTTKNQKVDLNEWIFEKINVKKSHTTIVKQIVFCLLIKDQ